MNRRSSHPLHVVEALEARRLFNLAPFGLDQSLSNGTTDSNVAVAADGAYSVTYRESGEIKLVRFGATGGQIGQPIDVVPNRTGFASASDAAGNVVIVYTQDSPRFDNADELWFVRVARDGTVGTPQKADATRVLHDYPTIATDRDGDFFLGWVEPISLAKRLKVRAYDAAGNPRANTFELDPGRGFSERELVFAFTLSAKPDGSGLVYAIQEDAQDEHHQNLRVGTTSVSADNGVVQDFGFEGLPELTTYDDGSFALAFYDIVPTGSQPDDPGAGFVQRFNADGTPKAKAVQLGTTLPLEGLGVAPTNLAATPDGGFIVTYEQLNPDTMRLTRYAQRFDRFGRADDAGPVDYFSSDEPRITGSAYSYFASDGLGVDAAGNAVVTYPGVSRNAGSDPGFGTHVDRLSSSIAAMDNGTLWVLGTRKSDAMSVKQRGGSIFAAIGNSSLKFAASRVKGIDLEGSNGNDRIFNETSIPSTIRGGSGNDFIQGGNGNDLMRGNAGDDDLSGNDGDDVIWGDSGNDILVGNNGNDRLDGGAGRDRVYGYAGNDSIFAQDGELDRLFGNAGRDTLDADGSDSVVD